MTNNSPTNEKYLTAEEAAKNYGKEVVFILWQPDENERRRGKTTGHLIAGIEDNRVTKCRLVDSLPEDDQQET